jgi:hypothetical protein
MSCIQGFALVSFSIRLHMHTLVTAHAIFCQTRPLVDYADIMFPWSSLLFMQGDNVSITFLVFINCLHGDQNDPSQHDT